MITANRTPAETDLLLSGSAAITAAESQDRPPTVEIVAYAGGLITVAGWGVVAIDLTGLEFSGAIPLLADHDSRLSGIVGRGEARIEAGKLLVSGTIIPSAGPADAILQLARGGFQFQSSVGVRPTKTRRIAAGEKIPINGQTLTAPRDGFVLVERGKLREVSILALGADDQTNVTIQGKAMPDTLPTEHDEAVKAERQRIKKIHDACGQLPKELRATDAVEKLEAQAIEGEITFEDLQAGLLRELRNTRPAGPARMGGTSAAATQESLEANLLIRAGLSGVAEKEYGERTCEAANSLRIGSLMDLCAAALRMDGKEIPQGENEMIRAAFSTLSLPTTLGNAAHKAIINGYMEAGSTWRSFATVRSVANFKEHKGIRPTKFENLDQIGGDGEVKHTNFGEAVYTFSADTYARQFRFTRKDMIDDDLGILSDSGPSMGRAAARSLNDLVWTVIMANAGSFFAAGNANLGTGAGSDLSLTSLEAAVTAMRTQRDDRGNDLDIMPRVLVVPPELEVTAKEILRSVEINRTGDGSPMGNALQNVANLEVESRLSNTDKFSNASTTAWYLFASPMDVAVIVAFLMGRQTPTVEFFGLDSDINTLGVGYRVYFDYGAALADPKAAYKADGA